MLVVVLGLFGDEAVKSDGDVVFSRESADERPLIAVRPAQVMQNGLTAIQRDFSQVLAISEKQINHKAYELADDVRNEFPTPGEACNETFDRILSTHPYVAHLMIYDPENGFVMRSQPYVIKNTPGFHDESEYMSKVMEGWWKLEYDEFSKKLVKMEDKGTPYYFEEAWMPRGDKHVYSSTAIFLRTDEKTGSQAIAGAGSSLRVTSAMAVSTGWTRRSSS